MEVEPTWRFSLQRIFESLIKVAKKSLKAIVRNAGLNDDELQTVFKEVEVLMS